MSESKEGSLEPTPTRKVIKKDGTVVYVPIEPPRPIVYDDKGAERKDKEAGQGKLVDEER